MALVNVAYLQNFSGVLRWLDENGDSVGTTTLSDTSVDHFAWGQDGQYFYTLSSYSTGRIEKWARDGSAYTWRYVKDNTDLLVPLSNGDLAIAFSDDAYILNTDDGTVDHSNVGSDMYQFGSSAIGTDPSDNVYIIGTDFTYYTYGMYCYVFDNTLTLSTSFQVTTASYSARKITADSSGNIFIAWEYHLQKYNSSGTLQWDYNPGGTSGALYDFQIANGYIYCSHNNRVACITDNGGSYTEEFNVDCSTDGYYGIQYIAVTADQIICFPSSATYNIHARDASDGTIDNNFTPYDITNTICGAGVDPLASVSANHFTVTHEIQYSRWVKTEGYEVVGHLETTYQNSIRGFGDVLIDKLFLQSNHKLVGTPRYGYIGTVGDPPSEDWFWNYTGQQYAYDEACDIDGNLYVRRYYYYTAGDASLYSDGYYTTADYYWNIIKLDSDGSLVWSSNIIIGTIYDVKIASGNDPYVYVRSGYLSGTIVRLLRSTGEQDDSGDWPINPLDTGDAIYDGTFTIGRDDKIYAIINDYTDGLPYIWKWDLDGSTATNWSTPRLLNQHATWGTQPNMVDVNSSGDIVVACIKVGDGGPQIHVYLADQSLSWTYSFMPDYNVQCYGALIDEDGDVYGDEQYYGITKIYSGGASGEAWTTSNNRDVTPGAFFSVDGEYLYSRGYKIRCSDGAEMYGLLSDESIIEFSTIHPLPSPAWGITVTFGSNGVVKTYGGDGDSAGVELTSGDIVYAEAGEDYRFQFVGDTGYYVDEVTVDSTSLGYRSTYTFENVLYRHTLHVTFGTGFPSGPFTMDYAVYGGLLETINCGHLSESYELTIGKLQWFEVAGAFTHTYALTGTGYLPWEISLLYLINSYRSDNSVASVTVNDWLVDGAEYAVADMIANGSLTLTMVQIMGQDGANYPYLYAGGLPTILDESFTPQELFAAWIADGPTEAMILNSDYDEVGIVVENYAGDNYVFVLFAQWHWQYQVVRMTENFEITYSLGDDVPFFDFMSAETYATLLDNSASVYLPRYRAKLGTYEIPNITAFTYRLQLETPSYLEVHAVFDKDVFDYIETHQDDGLIVESIINYGGSEVINEVVTVDFTTFSKVAGEPHKLMVAGYSTQSYYESTVALRNVMVRVKDEQGKTRFRCSQPDFYIRPGCTVTYSSYSIVVERVVIFVSDGITQYMEITGA